MIILILLFSIAAGIALAYIEAVKRSRYDNITKINNCLISDKEKLYSLVLEKVNTDFLSEELENLISYDIFKESCISKINDALLNEIGDIDTFVSGGINKEDLTFDMVQEAIVTILNSTQLDTKFVELFVNKVSENVKEAEQIEKDAVAYHKAFGTEPKGEPVLHSKEPNTEEYAESEIQERSVNDLYSTGTVEEFEDE